MHLGACLTASVVLQCMCSVRSSIARAVGSTAGCRSRYAEPGAGAEVGAACAASDNGAASLCAVATLSAFWRASAFCDESAPCAWMMSVPETIGVAPGTRTLWIARLTVHKGVWTRVEAVAAPVVQAPHPAVPSPMKTEVARPIRTATPKPTLPPPELRRKAYHFFAETRLGGRTNWGPETQAREKQGAVFGAPLCGRMKSRPRFWVHFPAPFFSAVATGEIIFAGAPSAEATSKAGGFFTVKLGPCAHAPLCIDMDDAHPILPRCRWRGYCEGRPDGCGDARHGPFRGRAASLADVRPSRMCSRS